MVQNHPHHPVRTPGLNLFAVFVAMALLFLKMGASENAARFTVMSSRRCERSCTVELADLEGVGSYIQMTVTIVTVAYGRRLNYLLQTLDAAMAEDICRAIIVNNGAFDDIRSIAESRYGGWAVVLDLGANLGSAAGFKAGIAAALEGGAEHILLLDDDNRLGRGCVATLQAAFDEQARISGCSRTAVLGFRKDRHARLGDQAMRGGVVRRRSTFRGFHVLDLPAKVLNRFGAQVEDRPLQEGSILVAWAPYGGLFFHQTMIDQIGLPREDFVLYEDDTEFTRRLVEIGGALLLVTRAEITDLERSWNRAGPEASALAAWVTRGSDLRAYYAFRNGVFCDFRRSGVNHVVLGLNAAVYFLLLFALGAKRGNYGRFCILLQSFRDGVLGRLGVSERFPMMVQDDSNIARVAGE